jgi:hypothetical protein
LPMPIAGRRISARVPDLFASLFASEAPAGPRKAICRSSRQALHMRRSRPARSPVRRGKGHRYRHPHEGHGRRGHWQRPQGLHAAIQSGLGQVQLGPHSADRVDPGETEAVLKSLSRYEAATRADTRRAGAGRQQARRDSARTVDSFFVVRRCPLAAGQKAHQRPSLSH